MATSVQLTSQPYRPSSPLTGDENSCVYRAANLMLSGQIGNTQYRAYAGSYNIGETFTGTALSGTISFSPASTTITGVSTKFLDEIHEGGQIVFAANGEPLVVAKIVTQTSFICARLPTTTQSGVAASVAPRLEPLGVNRVALNWGDIMQTDRGNLLTVGSGVVHVNGNVLPGTSVTASRKVQLSIYNSTSLNYSTKAIGFAVEPVTANTDVTVVASGGTQNTGLGYYSFKIGYYSDVTNGYSNPGATLLQGGLDGYHVTVVNSTFNFNFASDVSNRPANSTGYIVYGTAFTNSSDQSKINAIQGPWFEIIRIPYSSLTSNQYAFDYIDADLGTQVSFDNDAPPDADWIVLLAGYVVLVSCEGQGVNTSGRTVATSPGPFIFPMKGNNLDAYPASFSVATEKGENIIGQITVSGRLFVMTPNTLQATTPTGLDIGPVTLRPFWKLGFANPKNLTVVGGDTFYGFTSKGMYRSIATGDSAQAVNDFAAGVNTQMATWQAGYVYVDQDPKNRCVCVFHTGARKNANGWWVTDVFIYNLDIYDWTPPIILSDDTRDMIVTGTAVVQNELYFIAGGRRNGTTARYDTFSWDNPLSEETVDWYASWNYTQSGQPLTAKCVRKVQPRGQFTNASVQVYAATPNSTIDISDLDTGANAAFSYNLDDSTIPTTYEPQPMRVRNALMWTVRIGGTSQSTDGTMATLDTLDEITVYLDSFGQVR